MGNYYNVGTKDNPVISNSSLSQLNPEEGGSPIAFLSFFSEREEEKTSLSMDRGKLIHKYIEKPEEFIIADIEKPTPMMSGLLESTVIEADNLKKGFCSNSDVDITISSSLKLEKAKQAEVAQAVADFEKLGNFLGISTDDAVRAFRIGKIKAKAYLKRHDAGLVNTVVDGKKEMEYLKFLLGTRNKIVLDSTEGEKIRGAVNSLYTHPKVSALLGLGNNDFETVIGEKYKELEIYWSEKLVEPITGKQAGLNCKALLDDLLVNHDKRFIRYNDLKSTKGSLYTYQSAFEYYRTFRQIAIYNRALRFWFSAMFPNRKFDDYTIENNIIPVETHGLYLTGIYEVSQPWIFKGREEAKHLMQRYLWHSLTGEWRFSQEEVLNNGVLKLKNPE